MANNNPAPREKKPLTEIEALHRIQKILDKLDEHQRTKVLAFLGA